MWVHTLRVTDLRRFESAEVVFGPGLNFILGPNGAGKTTLLEALFLLSYGRSFRKGSRDSLLRLGAERYTVHARLQRADGSTTRVGLERHGARWTARADEQDLPRLSDLYARCAVCCFEPGSHELIGGGGEGRRAYLDWGVFHVEPGFLPLWRRCQRALEQRAALLRTPAAAAEFAPWHEELGRRHERPRERPPPSEGHADQGAWSAVLISATHRSPAVVVATSSSVRPSPPVAGARCTARSAGGRSPSTRSGHSTSPTLDGVKHSAAPTVSHSCGSANR